MICTFSNSHPMCPSKVTQLGLLALVAIGSLASACVKKESVDSTDIATQGMSLEFHVTNDGTQSKVYTALHVGSYQSLVWAKLSTGDELVLYAPDGNQHRLGVLASGDKTAYGTNTLVLPPSFTISAPAAAASRAETLKLSWTRSDGSHEMRVAVDGPCIIGFTRQVIGDPGEYVINGGELKPIGGKASETCKVTATVTRTVSTNSGFSAEFSKHPSNATGIQIRTVLLDSKP